MKSSGDFSLSNLSLVHWIGESNPLIDDGLPGIFRNPAIYRGAWNSIKLAFSAAIFSALLGVVLGYSIVKGRGTWLSKIVEQLAFIPYVIPGIAFGAVYISMFAQPVGPIPALYGTFALLVVVSVAKNLPFSSRTGVTAMMQVGKRTGGSGQGGRSESLGALHPDPFSTHQKRIHLRIFTNLHYNHAGIVFDHPFGNPGHPGSCKYDDAIYRKWKRAKGRCSHHPIDRSNSWW